MATSPVASLSESLAGHFPAASRDQGGAYVQKRAVCIERGGATSVKAHVHGGPRLSRVTLTLDQRGLGYRCNCPEFGGRAPCRHVWATLVTAERLGHLRSARPAALAPPPPPWRELLPAPKAAGRLAPPAAASEILYVVELPVADDSIAVELLERRAKRNGEWGEPKPFRFREGGAEAPAEDRTILAILEGPGDPYEGYRYWGPRRSVRHLQPGLARVMLPMLCATGRCRLRPAPDAEPAPLAWEDASWAFGLELRHRGEKTRLRGILKRGEESRPLAEALRIVRGLVFFPGQAGPLDDGGCFEWIAALDDHKAIQAPRSRARELLADLLRLPRPVPLDLPDDLRLPEERVRPTPVLRITPSRARKLACGVRFDYDGVTAEAGDPAARLLHEDRLLVRDREAESAALGRLAGHGVKPPRWELAAAHLPHLARALSADGWRVEADGKLYRSPGRIRIEVSSGIDWFDLQGAAEFEGQSVPLPRLLAALKRGEGWVVLDDGTLGLLPEEWIKRHAPLVEMGRPEGDALRFGRAQVGVLDALLAAQSEARVDEGFERARTALRRFEGVRAAEAPSDFEGELRPYQRDGLGWLHFLRGFGFGGCLADDMGLGKTVQVLALLESRRAEGAGKPSLVVVPRSLVFNWLLEARRFAPRLRVLAHAGADRPRETGAFAGHDVVLTTYGTLRRDALLLKDAAFDYAILDEAQAIKNHDTESAKAARLLQAAHRLALSGTPVENHLGELWSLFEFLNPGMLGRVSTFQGGAPRLDDAQRALLARALRPFILRRTKQQVAIELPAKLEQTLYCDLEPAQRRAYDSLRDHYRASLLGRVAREGLERSKIQVLEALLRLRQAACHPGLIDPALAGEPCAKLEALLPQIAEVVEEGHKALVFSQFTSFLGIVRQRLREAGIAHEYLDGKTRDRRQRVERFQEDPACGVFLVSLKAGGVGLNLTAAEYVFLLDPWWNPAVEAQAVDRAHRIGQTRRVFAYRLVARDTVEEKVLQLQETKRSLADAIINADNGLIRGLGREDLELLLS